MARPRTSTDQEILQRIAPAAGGSDSAWTLAGAAQAAGLHPATLIKRFGSREGVLRVRNTSSAGVLARIDMLAEDLRNRELRDLLHQGWQLDHLTVLVKAAVDHEDLRLTTPPGLVARPLMDTACGALLRAAVAPDPHQADPCTAVHDLLEALA